MDNENNTISHQKFNRLSMKLRMQSVWAIDGTFDYILTTFYDPTALAAFFVA